MNSCDEIKLLPKIVKEKKTYYEYIGEEGNLEQENSDDFYVKKIITLDCLYLDMYINGVNVSERYYTNIFDFFIYLRNSTSLYQDKKEKKGFVSFGSFYPLTCTCGNAGCAGIYDGIHIKRRKHTIDWNYRYGFEKIFKKEKLKFRRDLYELELLKLWQFMAKNLHNVYIYDEYSEFCRTLSQEINYLSFNFFDGRNKEVNLLENIKYISSLKSNKLVKFRIGVH